MLETVYKADLGTYTYYFFNLRIMPTVSQGRRKSVSLDLPCYDINTQYDTCLNTCFDAKRKF